MTVENGDYNKRDYGKKIFTAPMVQMKSQEESDFIFYGGPQLSHQIQITHIKYKLLTSKTNCSRQIQITHIKYKILTSKTRLNGQWLENENYVQFSLGLDPTAILLLHMVLSSGCFAATAGKVS